MPKKVRELKEILRQVGFTGKPSEGSHEKWKHPQLSQTIIIAEKDGSDAKSYLEEQVNQALRDLERMDNDRLNEEK